MKLKDIFKISIETACKNDPRKERLNELLEENKKEYEKSDKKENFREDFLYNPYSDSNIHNIAEDVDIEKIAIGIDTETQELLLVDSLNQKGAGIQALWGHHPEGLGLLELYKMIRVQEDVLYNAGVSVSSAEKIMSESYDKYKKSLMGLNYDRAVTSAKLLGINYMTIHTPADNMVHTYLENLFKKEKPYKLKDIIDLLMNEEEYKNAEKRGNPPVIINGSEDSRTGKIYMDVTGGVEASDSIYQKLESAGISTLVGMHMSESHLKKAREYNINVIMAGHMSSDSLGMNLLIDEIEKIKKFKEIIEMSGFKRHSRI